MSVGNEDDYPPPVCNFPEEGELKDRFEALKGKFISHFEGEEPTLYLRVPGRVNLIGEHVDYCGFSVCPMAIQQDLLVAASPLQHSSKNFIELTNLETEKYPDYTSKDKNFKIDIGESGWASYFLCGVKGILERNVKKTLFGIRAAISGNIPPSAGLSSSSALVSAATLATAQLNQIVLSKRELVALSADSERFIGTVGGGMDQAIAFLANKGYAKHIEFSPLRTEDLCLPKGASFIIAHSMVTMNKAATAHFNTRVIETRLAAQVIAKRNSLDWRHSQRLAQVQAGLGLSLKKMVELIEETLHEEPYTKLEVCDELNVTEEELNKLSLTPNTEYVKEFRLRQRALHVFQEALRVVEWRRGCVEGWSLERLGTLMTESHRSLTSLYDCSHPRLDDLVQAALKAGAKGARLTGAGWGGCIVALTEESEAGDFVSRLKRGFYSCSGEGDKEDPPVLVSLPSQGAQVFLPS